MYIKNYLLAAGISLGMLPAMGNAQTVSTFDDLTLPGSDTDFATTQPTGAYSFQSGHVLYHGELTSWGGYSGFNYSNMRNDTTQDFTNDKSAITATGYDSSANYGICFVPLDFQGPDPTATIPVGAKLEEEASGHSVVGAYITNTTYAYWYMKNYFQSGNWFQLTVRGYLNGQQSSDSVTFMLGNITDSTTEIVKTWTWVDLSALGDVDSLSFDLSSNDTAGGFGMNNPAYFAIDNLTTLDADVDTGTNGIGRLSNASLALKVWPNPAYDVLHLSTEHPLDIIITNVSGRKIWAENKVKNLNVSALPAGLYFLQAVDRISNKRGSIKFIKK